MRVLPSTIGSRGDVQPLLALALQLREHGRDVRTQFEVIPVAAEGCDVLVGGGALQIARRSLAEQRGRVRLTTTDS